MTEAKLHRQKKICYLRIREKTLEILTDPERFDGKHGVALTLYLALLMQAPHQERPEYPFPEGNWKMLLETLHEKYRWPEETIDAALRMLCRNNLLENQKTGLAFPEAEHTFGSEWPSAASMRRKRQREAQERKKQETERQAGNSRLAHLKQTVNRRQETEAAQQTRRR